MAGRLEGKRVLITAAAQGIGRASAIAMAREGASVLATDINTTLLVELEAEDGLETAELDVTDAAAIARLAEEQAPFDVLANVAGFVHAGSILDCDEKDLRLLDEPQREVDVPHDPRLPAGHARAPAAAASSTCPRSARASRACPTASSTAPARPR